jgi:hypothetical protein
MNVPAGEPSREHYEVNNHQVHARVFFHQEKKNGRRAVGIATNKKSDSFSVGRSCQWRCTIKWAEISTLLPCITVFNVEKKRVD